MNTYEIPEPARAAAENLAAAFENPRRKVLALEYFGRRMMCTEIRKTSRTDGERVIVKHWLDDADPLNGGHAAGTVIVQHVTGDGRIRDGHPKALREFARFIMTPDGEVRPATDTTVEKWYASRVGRVVGVRVEPAVDHVGDTRLYDTRAEAEAELAAVKS